MVTVCREQATGIGPEHVDPSQRNVTDPRIDDNGVGRLVPSVSKAVGNYHDCVRARREIVARAGCELGINLDGHHTAAGRNDLGDNGSVVARARANVDDMHSVAKVDLIIQFCPKAGLTIVDPACLVQRDQHIMG